jgi:hypothetical protein
VSSCQHRCSEVELFASLRANDPSLPNGRNDKRTSDKVFLNHAVVEAKSSRRTCGSAWPARDHWLGRFWPELFPRPLACFGDRSCKKYQLVGTLQLCGLKRRSLPRVMIPTASRCCWPRINRICSLTMRRGIGTDVWRARWNRVAKIICSRRRRDQRPIIGPGADYRRAVL